MFALESIKPQSKAFFNDLTAAFEELRKEKYEDIDKSEYVQIIEAVIKNYTGLNVDLVLEPYIGPSVEIPRISKSHPLLNEFRKEYTNNYSFIKELNIAKQMIGSVSLASGKVSGIFADQKNVIHFPLNSIKDKNYTGGEIAAIVLHEVGHLITFYEYISRTVSTNQVLANINRELAKTDSPDRRTTLFLSLREVVTLTDEDIAVLEKTTKPEVITAIVVSAANEQSRSELGNSVYDTKSWEQLSDDYVTRLQAGKELVSGLSKSYKLESNMAYRSSTMYLFMEAMKFAWLAAFLISSSVGFGAIFVPYSLLLIFIDGFGGGDHDRPGARFTRVRNQIVDQLKNPKLPKEDISRLNEDLDFISNVLEEINDRRQFLGVLFDFLGGRANRKHILLQQQLEELANNELFVKASKFKILN